MESGKMTGNKIRIRSGRFFELLLMFIVLSSCRSLPTPAPQTTLDIERVVLSKELILKDDTRILDQETNSFSTDDPAVVAWVRYQNLSGKHTLRWEWIDPDGMLYIDTGTFPIASPPNKPAVNGTAYHQILIKGETAEQLPGEWKVIIYADDRRMAMSAFDLYAAPNPSNSLRITRKTALIPMEKIYGPDRSTVQKVSSGDLLDNSMHIDADVPQSTMSRPDAVAVVIGNKDYRHGDIPDVAYAGQDAGAMKEYMTRVLGLKPGNILYYEDVTKAGFEAIFGNRENYRGRLNNQVKPGISEVFIYYSGHGAPDPQTRKAYFLPVDCEPDAISLNGYPLDVFYKNLSKINAKRIIVILDACFSGGSSPGEMLVRSASPALLKTNPPSPEVLTRITVLASSGADQISSWYDEKHHGLFTYFFLKALGGEADMDKDGDVRLKEIYAYVSDKAEGVPYWAHKLFNGRLQEPVLEGDDADLVMVRF